LLDSDHSGSSADTNAWEAEIRARVKAVDEDRAVGIRYEQINGGDPTTREALIKAMQASPDRKASSPIASRCRA
jgi:hypothetical protein